MNDHSQAHLRIIGQLAKEYEQKYNELETVISQIPRENIPMQLRALAERTTDRFRSAQIGLFSQPEIFEREGAERALAAATALCRAFDEMRILFQFLMENPPDRPKD